MKLSAQPSTDRGRGQEAAAGNGTPPRPHDTRVLRTAGMSVLRDYGLFLLLIVGFAAFAVALPDSFATSRNISAMLSSQMIELTLTLGLVIALAAGDFDLSVSANAVMCGISPHLP